jgi:polyhydroxyalkanoate synthesis regulator protein
MLTEARHEPSPVMAKNEPLAIKKYADRRIYNLARRTYVTPEHLFLMVDDDEDFVVYETNTTEDVKPSIVEQIICEHTKHG